MPTVAANAVLPLSKMGKVQNGYNWQSQFSTYVKYRDNHIYTFLLLYACKYDFVFACVCVCEIYIYI